MAEKNRYPDGADHDADEDGDHRDVAVGAFRQSSLAVAENAKRDSERIRDNAQRFHNSKDAGGGDRSHPDKANVVAVNLQRGHLRDWNGRRIDQRVHVAANEPDQRDEHEVGQDAAGAQDGGSAQAHHVTEAERESDGVEAEDHAGALGNAFHDWNELEVEILLPDLERSNQ